MAFFLLQNRLLFCFVNQNFNMIGSESSNTIFAFQEPDPTNYTEKNLSEQQTQLSYTVVTRKGLGGMDRHGGKLVFVVQFSMMKCKSWLGLQSVGGGWVTPGSMVYGSADPE